MQKWLDVSGDVKAPKYVRASGFGKLTGFADEVALALKAYAGRTPQDRRTGKALFVHVKARGYEGGFSRVTDFIRAWRVGASKQIKAFVPLKFDLGEA